MKRLFIAVKIAKDEKLTETFSQLRTAEKGVKWIDIDNLHLTLAFLGETDEKQIHKLIESLSFVCSKFPVFQLEKFGLGAFGNKQQPHVIWMGIKNNLALNNLYIELCQQLQHLGFELEKRPFKPHVTLGRIKNAVGVSFLNMIQKHHSTTFGSMVINEVILFESTLTPQGPVYKEIHAVKLL